MYYHKKKNRDKMLVRVNQAFEIYDIGDALPVYIPVRHTGLYTASLRPHTLVA